jgi:hypothetical protein
VDAVKGATPPVRLFPIYFPIGNLATGFFVIFALLASAVGIATSLTGLRDVTAGYPASMMSATASAIVTWTLTLLAMGLACKEISIGWRPPSLVSTRGNNEEFSTSESVFSILFLWNLTDPVRVSAARPGDVHHHLGGDAAALRRLAACRSQRGHRGDAHGSQSQSLIDLSSQAVGVAGEVCIN